MEIIFFIIEELDELVQCKTCKEKESIIQKVENKITEEYGKKFTKNQEKWVDTFETLAEETKENKCSK